MVTRRGSYSVLTTSQVAKRLNVHINTVRRWNNQGVLKGFRIGPRGDRRFSQEDISLFLSGHSTSGHYNPIK